MIVGVAVVPTTPLGLEGLPGRPHPEIATIGAAARRAAEALAGADVVIAIAGGPDLGLSDTPDTDLTGYGLHGLPVHDLAPAPAPVLEDLRRALGAAPATADAPAAGLDIAVLARHVPAGVPCAAVTIPADTPVAVTTAVGRAVLHLAAEASLAVLVAGDLAAGHGPKPPRPEAAAVADTLDGLVVTALDGGRPADLVRLDPTLVAAGSARAAGALRVLGTILDGARIGTVVRRSAAPLGVGYVVAQGG